MPTKSTSNHYYPRAHIHQGMKDIKLKNKTFMDWDGRNKMFGIYGIYVHRRKLPKSMYNWLNLIKA